MSIFNTLGKLKKNLNTYILMPQRFWNFKVAFLRFLDKSLFFCFVNFAEVDLGNKIRHYKFSFTNLSQIVDDSLMDPAKCSHE